MVNCSFCNGNIARGTGKIYVKKEGKIYYFCTSKCEKNMIVLGRTPRTTKWTGLYHKLKHDAKKEGAVKE